MIRANIAITCIDDVDGNNDGTICVQCVYDVRALARHTKRKQRESTQHNRMRNVKRMRDNKPLMECMR